MFSGLLASLYGTALVVFSLLLTRGWDFYTTPFAARPEHPDYPILRPAGLWGQGFGVVGTVLMLLLFLYSWRKRSRVLSGVGRAQHWLSLHIFCGIVGPLFIVLHSSFKVTGLVAVSFWAMVAIALSGVFGRYLYRQIPRTVLGHAMAPEDVRALEISIDRRLREEHGVDDDFLEGLHLVARSDSGIRSAVLGVMVAAAREVTLRRRLARFLWTRPEWREPRTGRRSDLEALARQKVQVHNRLHRLHHYQTAFHYWHVLHKPFAVIMVLVMSIHIGVAVALGYTWIF